MKTLHAVILAAGEGKRLLPFTLTQPKSLAEVGGTTILENAISQFAEHGVKKVSIVIGHLADTIVQRIGKRMCGMEINYIVNSDYACTNSMYSLLLALKKSEGPLWLLEGDVFFEGGILNYSPRGDFAWYADSSTRHLDGAYLKGDDGRVFSLEIIRDLKLLVPGHHKSIGLLHLSPLGVSTMRCWLEQGASEEKSNLYYDLIVAEHLGDFPIGLVDVAGLNWFEIDTNEDLKAARAMFSE